MPEHNNGPPEGIERTVKRCVERLEDEFPKATVESQVEGRIGPPVIRVYGPIDGMAEYRAIKTIVRNIVRGQQPRGQASGLVSELRLYPTLAVSAAKNSPFAFTVPDFRAS